MDMPRGTCHTQDGVPSGPLLSARHRGSFRARGFAVRLSVIIWLFCMAAPALAQDKRAGAETFFETKIRPVFAARCSKCHGSQKATNGLRVDSREALAKGGKRGPAVVAGHPEESLLIRAVGYQGDLKMPPNERLSADVVADLERWIAEGAVWPETRVANAAQDAGEHWAFKPVRSVNTPAFARDNSGTSAGTLDRGSGQVDRFVLAKLHEHGLQLTEPANKPTLLRRATFDLLGLPPTPAELDAFVADESPAAFAKVIDRLLASP